jgi:hypothetical protein
MLWLTAENVGFAGGGDALTSPETTKDLEQNGDTNTVPKETTIMGSTNRELAGQRIQEESLLS